MSASTLRTAPEQITTEGKMQKQNIHAMLLLAVIFDVVSSCKTGK